ncbi:MAG: hypothetical protein ACT4PV_12215 [Planctomycetaceae bacterium]
MNGSQAPEVRDPNIGDLLDPSGYIASQMEARLREAAQPSNWHEDAADKVLNLGERLRLLTACDCWELTIDAIVFLPEDLTGYDIPSPPVSKGVMGKAVRKAAQRFLVLNNLIQLGECADLPPCEWRVDEDELRQVETEVGAALLGLFALNLRAAFSRVFGGAGVAPVQAVIGSPQRALAVQNPDHPHCVTIYLSFTLEQTQPVEVPLNGKSFSLQVTEPIGVRLFLHFCLFSERPRPEPSPPTDPRKPGGPSTGGNGEPPPPPNPPDGGGPTTPTAQEGRLAYDPGGRLRLRDAVSRLLASASRNRSLLDLVSIVDALLQGPLGNARTTQAELMAVARPVVEVSPALLRPSLQVTAPIAPEREGRSHQVSTSVGLDNSASSEACASCRPPAEPRASA